MVNTWEKKLINRIWKERRMEFGRDSMAWLGGKTRGDICPAIECFTIGGVSAVHSPTLQQWSSPEPLQQCSRAVSPGLLCRAETEQSSPGTSPSPPGTGLGCGLWPGGLCHKQHSGATASTDFSYLEGDGKIRPAGFVWRKIADVCMCW